jgi:hypothetical protein
MLEPKIVAARIPASALGAHGAAAGFALIAASSHGCLKIFAIVLPKIFYCGVDLDHCTTEFPEQNRIVK